MSLTSQPPARAHESETSGGKATLRSRLSQMFRRDRARRGGVEVVPLSEVQQQAAGREATLQQLRKGYGEVVETMAAVRQHLEEQSHRSDRMLQLLEGLPDLLRQLPEQNERQTKVLEAIHTNLETQRETTGQLSTALGGLARATERQEQTAREIQAHLGEEQQSRDQLLNSLGAVARSSDASREAMHAIARQSEETASRVGELFQRGRRQMIAFNAVSWALAAIALVVAAYVAVMVGQVGANLAAQGQGGATEGIRSSQPVDGQAWQPDRSSFAPAASLSATEGVPPAGEAHPSPAPAAGAAEEKPEEAAEEGTALQNGMEGVAVPSGASAAAPVSAGPQTPSATGLEGVAQELRQVFRDLAPAAAAQ